jgi:polar amino acid transport system substrate-binding protein
VTRQLAVAAACIPVLALATHLSAQRGSSPSATLAPTGTLRAVFLGLNPVQGRIDPRTGKALGPVPDLVEALATRIGVPFALTSAPNAAGIIDALNNGQADVGFLAYDIARARDVDFGAAFMVMFNSYLVSGDSRLQRASDVDRPGVTVAAVRGQTQELFVSSHLKAAKVRVFEAMPPQADVERLLLSGDVDAFAINRQRAIEAEEASRKKLRALPDSFLAVDQSFVVRKGDRAKLPLITEFVDGVKKSGVIRASINRAGLLGVDVAK